MRAHLTGNADAARFADLLLDVGNGDIPLSLFPDTISIPDKLCQFADTLQNLKEQGEAVLLPRIPLEPTDSPLPFTFRRLQFPIKPAFALTINKSQRQTFSVLGADLREPCFSHGMFYVAVSRTGSCQTLTLLAPKQETRNVVYPEALNYTMPVVGLPTSLEVTLSALLQENKVTSWKICGEGDSTTVVLRLKTDTANSNMASQPPPVTTQCRYRKKSPSSISRNRRRAEERRAVRQDERKAKVMLGTSVFGRLSKSLWPDHGLKLHTKSLCSELGF
ncbi:hypothetical protein ACOMHN_023329 [Nucella lapillus]